MLAFSLQSVVVSSSLFLLLAGLPSLCQAMDYMTVRDCQRASKNLAQEVQCYYKAASEILQHRDDVVRLNEIAVSIRGRAHNDERKVWCGYTEDEQRVPFSVSGGKCSSIWNEWRFIRERHVNAYCHVGISQYDEGVIADRAKDKKLLAKYHKCFNRSIPNSVKQEFPIRDRISFIDVMQSMGKEYKQKNLEAQFRSLTQACNNALIEVSKRDRRWVKEYRLTCKL